MTSRRTQRRSRRTTRIAIRRAFTLLEIIVVVTIIALLATLVAPKLLQNIGRSKQSVAKAEVASIAQQVGLWCAQNEMSSPPEGTELTVLTEGSSPLLREKDLIDPWGKQYMLVIPGNANADFDVVTYGRDGQPGGEGEDADVVN
jgi:general secretion pathway protein G